MLHKTMTIAYRYLQQKFWCTSRRDGFVNNFDSSSCPSWVTLILLFWYWNLVWTLIKSVRHGNKNGSDCTDSLKFTDLCSNWSRKTIHRNDTTQSSTESLKKNMKNESQWTCLSREQEPIEELKDIKLRKGLHKAGIPAQRQYLSSWPANWGQESTRSWLLTWIFSEYFKIWTDYEFNE